VSVTDSTSSSFTTKPDVNHLGLLYSPNGEGTMCDAAC
jgi:hypothetical protein